MDYLYDFMDIVAEEFYDIIKRGKFKSPDEVHTYYELIDIVKDIVCIWNTMDGNDSSYGYGSYDDDYSERMSRARGRMSRANNRGQYSGNDYSGNHNGMRRYSRDNAKKDLVKKLDKIMRETSDEETQQDIQSLIQHMEH